MKTDGFLPRYNAIECFHQAGNHLFGIKFRVSPIIFEKQIDFSEYHKRGPVGMQPGHFCFYITGNNKLFSKKNLTL